MEALVLDSPNRVVVKRDHPLPPSPPPASFVTLEVHAAALNHRDCWIRGGKYPAIQYGAVLGADVCGSIVESAEEISGSRSSSPSGTARRVGERVLLCPTVNWGEDERAPERGRFGILGMTPFPGGLAERVSVPASLCYPVPVHLTDAEAAALPLAGLTAYRAVFTKGCVAEGTRVLITGIGGGVALFALQFCVAVGAEVWVSSSKVEKIERAIALGARGGVLYTAARWHTQLVEKAGERMDVVIDGAGGDALGALFRVVRDGGYIVSYGTTAGNARELNVAPLFLKNAELRGSTMGSPREFERMLEFVARKRLKPIVHSIRPLSEGVAAMDEMEAGKQFGKLVLVPSHRHAPSSRL